MAKYKFALKQAKPGQLSSKTKMHAIPTVVNRVNTRELCDIVTRNTSTSPIEAEAAFSLVCDAIPRELQRGSSVQLGRLGWLRLSFGSEGVEDINDFDAATMIKNIKVVFTPSKELLASVRSGISFENVGVVDGGFTFSSTKAYLEYKKTGHLPVTGGSGSGSEEGGGSEPSSGDEDSFG